MLQIASRAPLSLSLNSQPHALLPTGNSVPVSSEAFYTWIALACADKGFFPGAPQLGQLIRHLDAIAFNDKRYEDIHLRALKTGPASYKFDLDNFANHVIELTASGWKVASDFDTRFHRPDSSFHYLYPDRVKPKFHHCLQRLFHLDSEKSKALTQWMIQALLPGNTPPALILTGKARHEAAEKIRGIIDPTVCPIQALPTTTRQLGRLALTNLILAFSINSPLTKVRLAALNEIRIGMMVELRQVNKHRDPISVRIQRPLIISTAESFPLHEGQLEIEINQAEIADRSQYLTSLLNAAAVAIASLEVTPSMIIELESAAAPVPEPPEVVIQPKGPFPKT